MAAINLNLKNGLSGRFTRRNIHIVILALLLAAFIFFFSSRLWLPAAGTITETPMGTSFQTGNTTVSLKSWKINRQSNFMMVNIGIADMNFDVNISYNLGVYDITGNQIDFSVTHNEADFILLHIPNAKKYAGVSIGIQVVEEKNGEVVDKNPTVISFSALTEKIMQEDSLPENPDEKACVLLNLQNDVELMELRLLECDKSIAENNSTVSNAKKKITDKEQGFELQTGAEQEEAKQQIAALNSSIDLAAREIQKLQTDRFDIIAQIDAKQAIVQTYKTANNLA